MQILLNKEWSSTETCGLTLALYVYKYSDSDQRLSKGCLVVGIGPQLEKSQGQMPFVLCPALSLVVIVEIKWTDLKSNMHHLHISIQLCKYE